MNRFYKGIVTAIIFTAAFGGVQAEENKALIKDFKRCIKQMIVNHTTNKRAKHTAQMPCKIICKYGSGLKKNSEVKAALNKFAEIIMQPTKKQAAKKGGKKTAIKKNQKTMHTLETLKPVFAKYATYFRNTKVPAGKSNGKKKAQKISLEQKYNGCFTSIVEVIGELYPQKKNTKKKGVQPRRKK